MNKSQRTPKRRRSIFSILVALLFLVAGCLALVGAAWAYFELPQIAEMRFGPPSPRLSKIDQIVYAARLMLERKDILTPVEGSEQAVDFKIEMGESVPAVAEKLQSAGLIRSAEAFRHFMIYSGLDTGVQAGDYTLSPALNSVQIARALQDATPTEVSFSILPGWRAEEIADSLPTSGLKVTKKEFLALVNDPSGVNLPEGWPELKSLDGFLYPDVYRLKRDITAKEMVETFLKRFDEEVSADVRQAGEQQGFDLEQLVTMASIVQREAVVSEEQPMIASVFINRLNAGMELASDPTVQYALGYNADQKTWWTNPLNAEDLAVDSPYNTYTHKGLPPGPIANPALTAIQAVAYPAQTPYYYFRAKCDNSGRHNFAKTYEEHVANGCP